MSQSSPAPFLRDPVTVPRKELIEHYRVQAARYQQLAERQRRSSVYEGLVGLARQCAAMADALASPKQPDQHDIMPAEVLVEPLPRLCKPGAGHNLALGCGGLERIGERLDALRRDRDQHIDMLGGEATDLLVLLLMRRAKLDHAGRHEDTAAAGRLQHVEQFERRGKPDRVRVVGIVDDDGAVALPLYLEAMRDLRRAAQGGDDIFGRETEIAGSGECERHVAAL